MKIKIAIFFSTCLMCTAAYANNEILIGSGAVTDSKSKNTTIVGAQSTAKNGYNNVVIGANSSADGHHDCVIIGVGLKATRDYQVLIGNSKVQIEGREIVLKKK